MRISGLGDDSSPGEHERLDKISRQCIGQLLSYFSLEEKGSTDWPNAITINRISMGSWQGQGGKHKNWLYCFVPGCKSDKLWESDKLL